MRSYKKYKKRRRNICLVYVGNGDAGSYDGIDVKGKMVLVEVTYAPPVPEKARIASEMGRCGNYVYELGQRRRGDLQERFKRRMGKPDRRKFS